VPLIDTIRIEGLAQLNRSLRALGSDMPKALRLAANEAAEIVIDTARAKVPRRTGKASASIRASSTRTAARVTAGGRRAPYFPWLDYGGRTGRNNTARRPFIADGRYVYPAFREKRAEFERILRETLTRVIRDAGLEES
jgi:hypothetical protein